MSEAAMAAVGYVAIGWVICWAMFKIGKRGVAGVSDQDRACTFCIMWLLWPLGLLFVLTCMALED